MKKSIRSRIKGEYVSRVEWDFPEEHFGLGDKLLLYHVVDELITKFKKNGASIGHYAFINAVRSEMEDRFGYKPRERCTEFL